MGGGWSVKNLNFLNFVVHCISREEIFFWRRKKKTRKRIRCLEKENVFFGEEGKGTWKRRKI